MTESLEQALAGWEPGPIVLTRAVQPEPLDAFADLLDQPDRFAKFSEVPLLWHWFAFTASCPQGELGEDGHPAQGHFLPATANRRRMLAGGRLEQFVPLRVGRTYTRRSELKSVRIKDGRSGRMLFVTVRHTFNEAGDSIVAIEDEDAVYREQAAGAARGLPPDAPTTESWDAADPAPVRATFETDSRTLFRFSALTYNTHRIHYDHPYVTEVEGYPGLVVHGPLLALQMLELPRRARRLVRSVSYRLVSPAFAGPPTVATWDGDELRVGAAGATRASAIATIEP